MRTYDFIIFGGTGQQGRICARDLLESGYSVLLAGRNESVVKSLLKRKNAGFTTVDLRDSARTIKAIRESGAAVVVNCAELTFNIPVMRACLETQKSCTDLGGLQEITRKQFAFDARFRKAGIIALTGCGSTPGISNVMAAHLVRQFDSVDSIRLGFAWNSNVKKFVIPYSMQSIFEEFSQPPVTFHRGKFVREQSLRCTGTYTFQAVGTQTTYCIVHSEVYTFGKYFKNKGLKTVHYMAGFPEHSLGPIRTLMELGFNSRQELEINGAAITPLAFTVSVLKRIKPPGNYREVENLWVKIRGTKNGKATQREINCIVRPVKGWEDAGSNVDTGRTISIMSQMVRQGLIRETGVYGPEAVIPCKPFFRELEKRKMFVYVDGKKIHFLI